MPKGPRSEKRPTDRIGNAAHARRIETGEGEHKPHGPKPGKDAAAVELGKRGGAARARRLTPEQRQEIARKGAAQRWKKPG
jgi:hypothetical protein